MIIKRLTNKGRSEKKSKESKVEDRERTETRKRNSSTANNKSVKTKKEKEILSKKEKCVDTSVSKKSPKKAPVVSNGTCSTRKRRASLGNDTASKLKKTVKKVCVKAKKKVLKAVKVNKKSKSEKKKTEKENKKDNILPQRGSSKSLKKSSKSESEKRTKTPKAENLSKMSKQKRQKLSDAKTRKSPTNDKESIKKSKETKASKSKSFSKKEEKKLATKISKNKKPRKRKTMPDAEIVKQSKKSIKTEPAFVDRPRRARVASLNALAKVRLLCENERDKITENESGNDSSDNDTKVEVKMNAKKSNKANSKNMCKALVPYDKSRKQVARKRKTDDDEVEILDRSCKRMASLNASAILAASYSPDKSKRSKSLESVRSDASLEISEMKIRETTVSRYEIKPSSSVMHNVVANHLIVEAEKRETVETVKQVKVSSKIRERLLGIARLERHDEKKKKKSEKLKSSRNPLPNNIVEGVSDSDIAGFQATKVQVTKVTQINTSQGVKYDKEKKKPSGHEIETILERDSSVVQKYQVQTKSTSHGYKESYSVQMQTTFKPPTSTNLVTVNNGSVQMPSPIPTSQVHLATISTPVVSGPILSSQPIQPTHFNYSNHAPLLQFSPNGQVYHAFNAVQPIGPMSVVNVAGPIYPHFASAFSVPHYATHAPVSCYPPAIYQPAGPLLQPMQDPFLIHKPIPFHPSSLHHVSGNPLYASQTQAPTATSTASLHGENVGFPQIFQQTPVTNKPQTVLFQTVTRPDSSMATLAFVHPNVHQQTNGASNLEPFTLPDLRTSAVNVSQTPIAAPSFAVPTENQVTINPLEHSCKGVQCSPEEPLISEPSTTFSERQVSCSTSSQTLSTNNKHSTPVVTVRPQVTKFVKTSSELKKRKGLYMPSVQDKSCGTMTSNSASSTRLTEPKSTTFQKQKKSILMTPNRSNVVKHNHKTTNKQILNSNIAIPCSTNNTTICVTASESIPRPLPLKKPTKKKFFHGWAWEGEPREQYVYISNEDPPCLRKCYSAIRHIEGDIIRTRDCVLLRSGPRKTDLPFVAKIAALWETPGEGEMMMSLLWYYRPEHTDLGRKPSQMMSEIFASKHRDVNSVACIDDKCYVLTYNEYCRYRRAKLANGSVISTTARIVPDQKNERYPRKNRLPSLSVLSDLVFCCRKVYDFRQKRILKNPI